MVRAYLYEDDESDGIAITDCEILPRGIVIAYHDGEDTDGQ